MKQHNTGNSGNEDLLKNGFLNVSIILVSMVAFTMLAQYAYEGISAGILRVLVPLVILLAYLALTYKGLKRLIHTPYFAISSLLAIALATAIGTFVLQNSLPFDFTTRYGENTSNILRILQFDDVFHSWWFVGLFVLMAGSLLKLSWMKGFSKWNLGFQLAHLSPIIILLGFWIDYFYGYRGLMDLEVNKSSNQVSVYEDNTAYVQGYQELDFQLRLDSFAFANYEPDYRIQLWRQENGVTDQASPHGSMNNTPRVSNIVASFPLEKNKNRRIYDTDIRLRMADFYPNFEFDYTYPDQIDTILPKDPGILLDLKTKVGEATLQLRTSRPGQNKIADPSLGASLEFYWEPPQDAFNYEKPSDVPRDDSIASAHASWADMGKIIFDGSQREVHFINSEGTKIIPLVTGKYYPFEGKTDEGFTIRYLIPDAKYLKSVPATKDDQLVNPVAKVQVWSKDINPYQTAYIYPGGGRKGGAYFIPGTDYILALESIKERQTKFWRSHVTVIDNDGNEVESQVIEVNEPFLYKGYRFYQSNYDPENPEYSGIGVSYVPGLYIVYIGFFLMVLGTIIMFYVMRKSNV